MVSRMVMSRVKHNSYFIAGLVLGLWLALAVVPFDDDLEACVAGSSSSPEVDEFEPRREEKLLGSAGQAGRSLTRPRYYSTELGMRAPLLAGALSSEDALGTRVAALNHTASRLHPALRFFITASTLQDAPGLANVVGFTDTREMLKPFHALKYLADNYLEEYDFFFLVSDTSFVNARRLSELVSRLSVSQDVYMGVVADDDSHYCTLEGGILISNSVLRSVHAELDWCVRNSYSPHHHENLGRCVLHAAHVSCMSDLQAETYKSMKLEESSPLTPALADAVTAHPVTEPARFYQLHAYVSRVYLEREQAEELELRSELVKLSRRHPPGYRNASWPRGLRNDPGLLPPPLDTRWDYLRWTAFNATHLFMPDDHRSVGLLTSATKQAVELVVNAASEWAKVRWGAATVELVEGAFRWEPAVALRYRLLLRAEAPPPDSGRMVRQVEVARSLGSARLVPVPYVTESARVTLLLGVQARAADAALSFLRRYENTCLKKQANTALLIVVIRSTSSETPQLDEIRSVVASYQTKYRTAQIDVLETVGTSDDLKSTDTNAGRVALTAALHKLSRDALVLLAVPHMEFNEEFLNRVRMNTIVGEQWFLPTAFARYAQYLHPRFVDADGNKPQINTGRFNLWHHSVVSFYRRDYDSALSEWQKPGLETASVADILSQSALRCIRAPEPGLVLSPLGPPCPTSTAECLRAVRDKGLEELDLGAKHSLAKLLLEIQAEIA